jgi:arylsulfatase
MGFIAEVPTSDPGYTARIPRSAATLPRLLRDAGWSTMAVGKWHLTPPGERTSAGPLDHWPLGMGFERFYGFLGGAAITLTSIRTLISAKTPRLDRRNRTR